MYMYIQYICVHVGRVISIKRLPVCASCKCTCTCCMYIYILISVIYTIGKFFDNTSASEPEIVQFPGNERVVDVQTGSGYILALTESGSVYTWGKNSTTCKNFDLSI